jgi:bifunctional non-homologous end joining protein LigD
VSDSIPFRVQPMLATLVRQPFHRRGWVYEEKYDGFRILAYKEGGNVLLLSRNANDRTQRFSKIAQAVAALPARTLLLDGEAVSFDRHNVSRFQLLQELRSEPKYSAFDCLYRDGQDLRSEPLARRRDSLAEAIGKDSKDSVIFLSARLAENGLKAYQIAKAEGFEGVLAKESAAPYVEGRSRWWLKFKVRQEDEFIVIGYTAPSGARQYFGAMLLGAYRDGRLIYVGKVGTGFTKIALAQIHRRFQPLTRNKPPLADPPREKGVTYLAPRLVVQIAYEEVTMDHKLRQPVFLGLRDDKRPEDITLPESQ